MEAGGYGAVGGEDAAAFPPYGKKWREAIADSLRKGAGGSKGGRRRCGDFVTRWDFAGFSLDLDVTVDGTNSRLRFPFAVVTENNEPACSVYAVGEGAASLFPLLMKHGGRP